MAGHRLAVGDRFRRVPPVHSGSSSSRMCVPRTQPKHLPRNKPPQTPQDCVVLSVPITHLWLCLLCLSASLADLSVGTGASACAQRRRGENGTMDRGTGSGRSDQGGAVQASGKAGAGGMRPEAGQAMGHAHTRRPGKSKKTEKGRGRAIWPAFCGQHVCYAQAALRRRRA